jgi:hypothetical protein
VYLLLSGALLAPFLTGLCLLVWGRSVSPPLRRGLTLGVLLLAAVCATALLGSVGRDPGFAIEWLPGTGPMTLSLGLSSLYVLLATSWAACLASFRWVEGSRQGTPYGDVLLLVALAAMGVALLSGHFLLRYVALEVVALCVALAPLAELRDEHGVRATFMVYLLLRVGDAGLLGAIVALWGSLGTLEIGPALAAVSQLPGPLARAAAAGFLLAVWVKVGAWPLQAWASIGRRLAPRYGAWLYATVFPNLGLYLLYRTVPFAVITGPLGTAALWLGAGAAVVSALLALREQDLSQEMTLPHAFAVLSGLAVVAASGGLQVAIWLSVLILTPLRVLLHLAARMPERDPARSIGAALGALGLGGWALILTYLARKAGLPSAALHLGEVGVALLGLWGVRVARGAWSTLKPAGMEAIRPARWASMGFLGLTVLAAPWVLAPLVGSYQAYHGTPLALPTPGLLVRYVLAMPAAWAVAALAAAVELWGKDRLSRWAAQVGRGVASSEALETRLRRIALALRRTIEGGILENGLVQGVQTILHVGNLMHRHVEQGVLEQLLARSVHTIMRSSHFVYRHVEQATLEGALRRAVRGVVGLARIGQRWHTGRLRRNLLWIVVSALLALVIWLLVW